MDIILTTPDQLKAIISECLANQASTAPPVQAETTTYLYSINELAKFLNCSPVTAQRLKNSGKIRFSQFGRKCIFSTEEILEDITKNQK
jgi:excisionase family DNA binding protein